MTRHGTFEPVALLHRTPRAAVWSARSCVDAGGPADHCLKRAEGSADDAAAAEELLAGAGVQQAMAFQSPAWAAVRALGAAGHGAFVVTDRFPRSAQTVIDGSRRLSSAELRTVFVAVLDALIELQVAYGRPHGNLKPSNVLIGRRIRAGTVCLTDPAADPTARPSLDRAPDPKAIGRLLYALVTHRPHTAARWPMPFDADWQRLGASGRQWFDLCRSLVHPLGDAAPDLDELMTQVVAIHPDRRRRVRRGVRRALAVGSVAAAVAGVGYAARAPIAGWYDAGRRQLLAAVQGVPKARRHDTLRPAHATVPVDPRIASSATRARPAPVPPHDAGVAPPG